MVHNGIEYGDMQVSSFSDGCFKLSFLEASYCLDEGLYEWS